MMTVMLCNTAARHRPHDDAVIKVATTSVAVALPMRFRYDVRCRARRRRRWQRRPRRGRLLAVLIVIEQGAEVDRRRRRRGRLRRGMLRVVQVAFSPRRHALRRWRQRCRLRRYDVALRLVLLALRRPLLRLRVGLLLLLGGGLGLGLGLRHHFLLLQLLLLESSHVLRLLLRSRFHVLNRFMTRFFVQRRAGLQALDLGQSVAVRCLRFGTGLLRDATRLRTPLRAVADFAIGLTSTHAQLSKKFVSGDRYAMRSVGSRRRRFAVCMAGRRRTPDGVLSMSDAVRRSNVVRVKWPRLSRATRGSCGHVMLCSLSSNRARCL
mmetsp:Transcript_27479/g.66692  ORF Transcript_27479/g.66692 Transcript_27479/m.66692 type:complete len:322 (+) Transcript_27479:268-1233(+)